jgi:hypothetical protein
MQPDGTAPGFRNRGQLTLMRNYPRVSEPECHASSHKISQTFQKSYGNFQIFLVRQTNLRKNDFMNRSTCTVLSPGVSEGGLLSRPTFCKEATPSSPQIATKPRAVSATATSTSTTPVAATLSWVRVVKAVMIPLLAGAGWVCLYWWWSQGGAALMSGCVLLELVSFGLLLGLLRDRGERCERDLEQVMRTTTTGNS